MPFRRKQAALRISGAIACWPCCRDPLGYHVRMPFPARRFHRFMPMRF